MILTITPGTIEEPTSRLRFVTREINGKDGLRQMKVLQQCWRVRTEGNLAYEEEWRDVPMEKET
jgi:hypothetical protein